MLINKALFSVLILAIPVCSEAGWHPDRDLKKAWREVETTANDAADAVVSVAHQAEAEVDRTAQRFGAEAERQANDGTEAVEVAAHQVEAEVDRSAQRIGAEAERQANDASKSVEIAAHQVAAEAERTGSRLGAEAKRWGEDVAIAVKQSGYFVDRQMRGYRDNFINIESYIRNGQFERVAFFMFYTWKQSSENASIAMQQSSVLRTVGQIAASAYGGPYGAAMFSTWYTYSATSDLRASLKVGAITFSVAYAFNAISDTGQTKDAVDVVERAIANGSINMVSTSALGGSQSESEKAFLLGAASSAAADVYRATTGSSLDSRASTKDAVCKLNPTEISLCAPPIESVVEVNPGQYETRVELLSKEIDQVGMAVAPKGNSWLLSNVIGEGSPPMTFFSKVPMVNGMAVFHDLVAENWGFPILQASIAPALAFTYLASGAPVITELVDISVESKTSD